MLCKKIAAIFVLSIWLLSIISCSQGGTTFKQGTMEGKADINKAVEGKDYLLLKRHRVIDPVGFSEPVEAASFLIPANWQAEGGIQWNTTKCLSDMVQSTLHGKSPDGKFELFILPTTQFDWVNHPQMMHAMRTGGYGTGCNIAEPMDAAAYIMQVLPGLVGASSATASPIASIEAKLKQQAAQYATPAVNLLPSAAEGKLQFADGSEGIALCSITQIVETLPGYDGSTIYQYQTTVNSRTVLKYPKGEEAQARNLLSTIQSSVRINTTWFSAIQTMFNNIRKMVQDENWKRIQITQQAQQEISNNITRSWEGTNKSSDKSGEIFSQYIRGVDSWTDESGNKVELSAGYSNAWQKADGSYLLSNNPSFDPNVTFQETWKALSK